MAKLTLDPMVGSYASVTALNTRFQQIENAFNDDVLWRNNPVGEVNTMANDLDMNGYRLLNVGAFDTGHYYLGPFASAPTEYSPGVPLDATHAGALYFNTTNDTMYVWSGSLWSAVGSTATSASSVSINDVGGHYTSTNVEDAFQELASVDSGRGASIVGVYDAGGHYAGNDVETCLAEVGNSATATLTNKTLTAPTINNPTINGTLTVNGVPVNGMVLLDTPILLRTDLVDTGGSWVTVDASLVLPELVTNEAKALILRVQTSVVGSASSLLNAIYYMQPVDGTGTMRSSLNEVCASTISSGSTDVDSNSDNAEVTMKLKNFKDFKISFLESGTGVNGRGDIIIAGYYV